MTVSSATVRLWSYHAPNFSLTSGRVNWSLSKHYNTIKSAPSAYAELAKNLGTDQIIWCCTTKDEHASSSNAEWELDVPREKIIAVVDEQIWNRILGLRCSPPASQRHQWRIEDYSNEGHYDRMMSQFGLGPSPPGGWWPQLFISDIAHENANALLPHPIPETWVVSKLLMSCSRRHQMTR